MNVQVYWNRTRKLWSIRDAVTRRVIRHASHLFLSYPLFHVNEAGRQRVLRTKVRTVHAWVEGSLVDSVPFDGLSGDRVYYNPWERGCFVINDTDKPIETTSYAWFDPLGQVWV